MISFSREQFFKHLIHSSEGQYYLLEPDDRNSLPLLSKGVLQPIQVSFFLVKAAKPPTLECTTVFVRV